MLFFQKTKKEKREEIFQNLYKFFMLVIKVPHKNTTKAILEAVDNDDEDVDDHNDVCLRTF